MVKNMCTDVRLGYKPNTTTGQLTYFRSCCHLWQELATFFCEGPEKTWFRLWGHIVSFITSALAVVAWKQAPTVHPGDAHAALQWNFTQGFRNLTFIWLFCVVILLFYFFTYSEWKPVLAWGPNKNKARFLDWALGPLFSETWPITAVGEEWTTCQDTSLVATLPRTYRIRPSRGAVQRMFSQTFQTILLHFQVWEPWTNRQC